MATVDAQVNIGDSKSDLPSSRDATMFRWPDSEVPRTAERLRDLIAVAITASTYVTQRAMSGHAPRDVGEITRAIATRQLIPPEWLTSQSGVLQTAHSTVHVRYAPNTLTTEFISMPATPTDGPALLIRIPDDENTEVGPRYFESMQVDEITYTRPFASIAEIISLGWTQRSIRQSRAPKSN
ncbi:MAG TPA: hypothetical protein VE863_03370 [Pyrinomonadaceae bacterium]|nr:hypothetical protein [Pyrinomonadaceae bacterium]